MKNASGVFVTELKTIELITHFFSNAFRVTEYLEVFNLHGIRIMFHTRRKQL